MLKSRSAPVTIGLCFAALGLALTLIGVVRGAVPNRPLSIFVALLIGGGVWFVVSWAIATAALDVEQDILDETPDYPSAGTPENNTQA